jgi:hypothetical protein
MKAKRKVNVQTIEAAEHDRYTERAMRRKLFRVGILTDKDYKPRGNPNPKPLTMEARRLGGMNCVKNAKRNERGQFIKALA